MKRSFRTGLEGVAWILMCVLLDQGSKYWVQQWMWGLSYHRVTAFFNIVTAWNFGVGWGFFPCTSWMGKFFLVGVTVIFLSLLWHWYCRAECRSHKLGLALILGGGLSNVLDRVIHGAVFDFLDLHFCKYHFHTFNIADTLISIGFLILLQNILGWNVSKNFKKLP